MEFEVLKACLESRDSYEVIVKYIEPKQYSREFQHLLKFVEDYYKRDTEAKAVSLPVLVNLIAAVTDNDKHVDSFKEFLERAASTESSSPNVEATILAAKEREVGLKLCISIADGKKDIDSLLEEYQSTRGATSLEALGEEPEEVLENIDVAQLVANGTDRANLFPLFPKSVGDRVDGGLEPGDSMLLFGMTEIGKTAFSIHHACGWAHLGKPGLYLINEDRIQRIAVRMVSNLSGMDKYAVQADPAKAHRIAYERGLGNIRLVQLSPGSPAAIRRLIEKYDPSWIVLDQIRNIDTGTRNNRVVQLEEAATAMRNIGKEYGIVTLNVTQAGESARNKLFLDTGDVDFSNVGIPGQADLMMGIGSTADTDARNERGVSLCKNKISGDHAQVIVKLNTMLSRVSSYVDKD